MDSVHVLNFKKEAFAEIRRCNDAKFLEETRIKYLGRKQGMVTQILHSLKDLSLTEKRKIGPLVNKLKAEIEEAFDRRLAELKTIGLEEKRGIDVTRPGKRIESGHLHPLTQIENKIKEIFLGLNFSVVEGPEIETEYYNFDALNIPGDHPARDAWNTFWLLCDQKQIAKSKSQSINDLQLALSDKLLLRTHTSPMQIRFMESHQPPFQIIVPGRVFRFEATDASHEINFYQVEGLMVGKEVSLANFKYIIQEFFNQLFGHKIEMRLRPSYFPFVEPGLEVDIKWKDKWLEVMGAGMVHPNVFRAVKYPRDVQGFAFGLGLERLAMIKYNIPDIRLFYSGDLRFIKQF